MQKVSGNGVNHHFFISLRVELAEGFKKDRERSSYSDTGNKHKTKLYSLIWFVFLRK